MIFRLTFLGTSASVPSAERNHPALLVEAGGQRILVDCGEGTQRQLLRSGAGFGGFTAYCSRMRISTISLGSPDCSRHSGCGKARIS